MPATHKNRVQVIIRAFESVEDYGAHTDLYWSESMQVIEAENLADIDLNAQARAVASCLPQATDAPQE